MPDFNIHLTAGVLTGTAMATAGFIGHDLDPIQAGAVLILGATGGLLPDIDSDSGKPLALLFQLVSVLIPILVYPHVKPGLVTDITFQLCYFPIFYLFINYLACPMVKKMTRHRGMMHSLPFAFLSAEAAYILLDSSGKFIAFYGSLSVFCGCLSHLILDELHAMSLKFGFIVVVKRSSGSALKLVGNDIFSTFVTYSLLLLFSTALVTRLFPDLIPFLFTGP
ncbi:MAG: metal-dependent hydrolase [Proteobacteria bacterium]|nr:metal-dependent hydrolase [Pseudomonadota bacterium]